MRTFLTAVDTTTRILADLDPAFSGKPHGSLDWLIGRLETGSLVIELESRPKRELSADNVGSRVARVLVEGLDMIEQEASTPPYFSDTAMEHALRLTRLIGRDGATGLIVRDSLGEAVLSPQAAENIAPLLSPRRTSLGSVEGKLGLIAIHRKPRFRIYEVVTHKAVTCDFDEKKWLDRVKDALWRRVIAYGVVYYNIKGEPLRVELDNLRILSERTDLPQVDDIGGMDPDLTGALSTAEYIRSIRDG